MGRVSHFSKNFYSLTRKSAEIKGLIQRQFKDPQKITQRNFCIFLNNNRNTFLKQQRSQRKNIYKQNQEIIDRRQIGIRLFSIITRAQFSNRRILNGRYELLDYQPIGQGIQAVVFKAMDLVTSQVVAIKTYKYSNVSLNDEKKVLQKLREIDPKGLQRVVKMLDYFENHEKRPFFVFEFLDMSLHDFMLNAGSSGDDLCLQKLNLGQIREIGYQLCSVVKFLHDNNLIHFDLKPDNICLFGVDFDEVYLNGNLEKTKLLKRPDIKIIDFGSALFSGQNPKRYNVAINQEFAPPECLLDFENWQNWKPFDVWSIGCILFILYTAEKLFPTRFFLRPGQNATSREHSYFRLYIIERRLGNIPEWMWNEPPCHFKDFYRTDWNSWFNQNYPKSLEKNLMEYISENDVDQNLFFDLIQKMLCCDPNHRITLNDAVTHPFFQNVTEHSTKLNEVKNI